LRHSEVIELGIPGVSRNTSPTVIPPQHVLGQIHQPITITSREKLIDLGDLTRLRTVETQWYEPAIRAWCRSPVYHSFQINRIRALTDWPEQDPDEIVHGLNYDQYKETWFNAFLWKSRFEFFYTQIRFAHMFRDWEEPSWIMDWWTRFGLNLVGVNPKALETARMFPQFHRPLNFISDLYSDEEFKAIFIQEKYPWILWTKFMLSSTEDDDGDPTLL
jgi:hypothetical protein